jgi:FAD/FMN-containing dehydrogenase
MRRIESWGRIRAESRARKLWWRDEDVVADAPGTVLAHGMGRSYGDSCLDDGGTLLLTRGLSRFISFDAATGLLACEAGVTLGEIIARFAPLGFLPAVLPGTKHVTVGGAIANDVHGKNHHRAGTFGAHVTRLELARSDGARLLCSPAENHELFSATIGGLGLTGLITWAELRLRRVPGQWLACEAVPFASLDAFFDLSLRSDATHEYTVAWVDALAQGAALGRGVFFRANHVDLGRPVPRRRHAADLPFDLPEFALNRATVKMFNAAYRLAHRRGGERFVHLDPFFFPLDAVGRWNRLYGRRGLAQFQCVLPHASARESVAEVLEAAGRSGQGSFLTVLKTFGDLPSPGLLSFPRPGVTVALDVAFRGDRTRALLAALEAIVLARGGALYPAKDATMSPAMFRASFPRAGELRRHADPRFSSSLWRRVAADGSGP